MWECKKCHFKNNNSSEKCHGVECEGTKSKNAKKKPGEVQNEHVPERIYDFCLVCKKDVILIETRHKGEKVFRCTNAVHRVQRVIGKTKPIPHELLNQIS